MTALLAAIAALILEFGFFAHAVAQPVRGQPTTALTLGLVAEANQKQVEEHFREFSRYVARRLTGRSAIEGQVTVAPSQARLARLLTERKVDFYFESAYPTYMINSVYGAGK